MNDEIPEPFDTVGDAAVEARIVAWVLGEASAFEIAELERLCAERPELEVFRRRMESLHGLLTEAEGKLDAGEVAAAVSWKLPAEKRQVLDEVFGRTESKVVAMQKADRQKEDRISRSGRRAFLAMAACVVVTFFITVFYYGKLVEMPVVAAPERKIDFMRSSAGGGYSNVEIRDQEDVVEERRKALASIVRNRGIIYKGQDSFHGSTVADEDKPARDAMETYNDLQQQKLQLESQINSLLRYDSDQLMTYASGIDVPDNTIKDTYPKYLEATRELDNLKRQGMGAEHPQVKAEQEKVRDLGRQADEGVVNLRATLQAQLDMAGDRLKNVEGMKNETREDAIKRGLDAQDYVDAKKNLEKDVALLEKMKGGRQAAAPQRQAPSPASEMATSAPQPAAAPAVAEAGAGQAEKAARTGTDFISPVNGTTVDGIPANPDQFATNGVTNGLRSGDQAINRNNIDAILNNPNRTRALSPEKPGEPELPASPAVLGDLAAADRFADGPAAGDGTGLGMGAGFGGGTGKSGLESGPEELSRFKKSEVAELSKDAGVEEKELAEAKSKDSRARSARGAADPTTARKQKPASSRPPVLAAKAPQGTAREVAGAADAEPVIEDEQAADKGPQRRKIDGDSDSNARQAGAEMPSLSDKASKGGFGLSELAQQEMIRRQDAVAVGDRFLEEGREAYAKGDYENAGKKYRDAIDSVPEAPMTDERRKAYAEHLTDASVAQAMQHRKVGKYNEARNLLEQAKALDPNNEAVKRELSYLDDPLRTNSALADDHTQNVDKVRRGLYTAEGNFNLGKYDEAKKEYENVLKTDPYNTAARRGLERVNSATSDYYRAAYDHTRAELLSQVDKAWELSVPADPVANDAIPSLSTWSSNRGGNLYEQRVGTDPGLSLNLYSLRQYKQEKSQMPLSGGGPQAGADGGALKDAPSELYDYNFMTLDEATKSAAAKPAEPAQPKLVDLMEEVVAKDDPYSTFSLNISDASFQVAKAALAKGERPDPAGIKPEQFYNAVDYGDPAPGVNEPVAATIEQSANPVVPGRNLVRVAVRTGSTGRVASQPLRLTLLVDQSGSMVRDDRRTSMEQALQQLAGLLTAKDKVTVIGFSRTPHLLADGLSGNQGGKLSGLVNQSASEGGTNLEEAMKLGAEMANRHKLDGAQNRVVLFTDGAANLGDADPDRLAKQVKALRQKGIAFDIAGIAATDLNDRLLGELARHGNGRYYVVGDAKSETFAKQLAGAFRPAAENVKIQVNFNPDRVGKYKLIGFEKDRLKTEDFRNDSVDAAELAADEAGVAIYQVEPLPEGKGELGEVSVRFRDTNSGEMVERTWTVPYDSAAPVFDRASPSMQLAGLSMMAAQKLRGGPLADAIDLKQFAEPAASVKQVLGGNKGVVEMLQVIDALK